MQTDAMTTITKHTAKVVVEKEEDFITVKLVGTLPVVLSIGEKARRLKREMPEGDCHIELAHHIALDCRQGIYSLGINMECNQLSIEVSKEIAAKLLQTVATTKLL